MTLGKNRRKINLLPIAEELGLEMCKALLGVYVFTGEDCNCAFKGKGKTRAIKLLQTNPEYLDVFAKLGESWEVEREIYTGLEKFTCHLYGLPRFNKVNKARLFKLKSMCGNKNKISSKCKSDLHRLPPCKRSLYPHIKRVNYQTGRLKRSHIKIPDIPCPAPDHGWVRSEDGLLEPEWTHGDILPQQIVDIVKPVGADTEEDSEDSSEVESENEGDNNVDSAPDTDYSDSDL